MFGIMFRLFRFFLDLFRTKKPNRNPSSAPSNKFYYERLEDCPNICSICNAEIKGKTEFVIRKQLMTYFFCREHCYFDWLQNRAMILG